jgi:hypothetical protein
LFDKYADHDDSDDNDDNDKNNGNKNNKAMMITIIIPYYLRVHKRTIIY